MSDHDQIDEPDPGARVLRMVEPLKPGGDLKNEVLLVLEEAIETAKEIDAIGVALVLVGSVGEVPTWMRGPGLQLIGAIRVMEHNAIEEAVE